MTQDQPNRQEIGYVVGGSLKDNLQARLTIPPTDVQEGSFVVIEDGRWSFNGLITDLQLGSTNQRFADEQTEGRLPAQLANLLQGQTLYTNAVILPQLMAQLPPDPDDPEYDSYKKEDRFVPIKTIPAHHAAVRLAGQGDINEIFGNPQDEGHFYIGYTREQGHKVCLDLQKLVKRSSGIFGATGTGKSFLTRIILAGLVESGVAGALIFDMHNEYGPAVRDTDRGALIPGLKNKFPQKVRLVGLGTGATFYDQRADFDLIFDERDIEAEDIEMLTRELNLKETTSATLNALENSFGRNWFHEFKKMRGGATDEDERGKRVPAADSVTAWAQEAGANPMAAEGLHHKMERIFKRDYIRENAPGDAVKSIIDALKTGRHVVLSFGNYENDLDYLLVANILTRKIRAAWQQQTEDFLQKKADAAEPRPLVIVIEEAHKLLNRELAAQTSFSLIAREMRKYYVTLLVVDQRPSQIDDEVISQLGTRVSGWLGDELDISAVLSGLASREALRGMLARLRPKEEVLLLGWGVPMPIPVRSRRYDDQFWRELLGTDQTRAQSEMVNRLLYGGDDDQGI